MKNITILGSTGSIGTQALEIIRNKAGEYRVLALAANRNADLLFEQVMEFMPPYVVLYDESQYAAFKERLKPYKVQVLAGLEGLVQVSTLPEIDLLLTAIVGMIGIQPTIMAIRANKTIALANKETMVAAGELIRKELASSKAMILPVDSEHSALFQCLNGERAQDVHKLILTASGGPFRGKTKDDLRSITPEQALKHPKWNMGRKISIDSATLMNKGLEVIEAHYLFQIDYDQIDVLVHPQSIIHSMVEYNDGSIIAQLSNTSMLHPIQYAFEYPNRSQGVIKYLNLAEHGMLTFEKADVSTFECLQYGYEAGRIGGSMPCILNAANEEAVEHYLEHKISFLEIPQLIHEAMEHFTVEENLTLNKIVEIEQNTRGFIRGLINQK